MINERKKMKKRNIANLKYAPVSHNPNVLKKVLLGYEEVPHVTFFSRATFMPDHIAPSHSHEDMYEIFYVEQGQANFTVGDKDLLVREGDCIIIEPLEKHEIKNVGQSDFIVYCIGILQK